MVILFVILVLSVALFAFATTMYHSATSTGTKLLPAMHVTAQTLRGTADKIEFCPKCGKSFDGNPFCGACGAPAQLWHTYRLPISGSVNAQKAEAMVNEFLAQNPYIEQCRMKISQKAILMFPFVPFRFRVKALELSYTLAEKPQKHRFGMAFLYKYRLFGSIGYSSAKLVKQWNENNRDCTVLAHTGSHIQHFSTQGNFEAHYYSYIFFKKPM